MRKNSKNMGKIPDGPNFTTVTISKNRGRFPDIWLEAAETMSQMCESLCRSEVDEMRDCTGII